MRQEIKLSDLIPLIFYFINQLSTTFLNAVLTFIVNNYLVLNKDQLWCSRDHRMVQWIYGGDDITCISDLMSLIGTVLLQDNPDGQLSKDKMMEMYSSVLTGTKSRTFVDQIFQKFDSDNSGSIDFKVFISRVKITFRHWKSLFIVIPLKCVRSSCWPLTCLRLATLRRNWDGLSKCRIALYLFDLFDNVQCFCAGMTRMGLAL